MTSEHWLCGACLWSRDSHTWSQPRPLPSRPWPPAHRQMLRPCRNAGRDPSRDARGHSPTRGRLRSTRGLADRFSCRNKAYSWPWAAPLRPNSPRADRSSHSSGSSLNHWVYHCYFASVWPPWVRGCGCHGRHNKRGRSTARKVPAHSGR